MEMMGMPDIFQFDVVSFVILIAMGCASLFLALHFYLKHRALDELSRNVHISVFDRTFNIFDAGPERRKSVNISILLPLLLVLLYIFMGFVILKILELGLMLGIIVFILSFSLMMIDEAAESHSNAQTFMKALMNRNHFGKGDLNALTMLRKTLPRLSGYYLLLAVALFASSFALSYIAPSALLGLSLLVGTTSESASFTGPWSIYVPLLAFMILFVTVYVTARKLKSKIFGFPPSIPFTAMEEPFERGVRTITHGDKPPFEMSHRPILEDPEVEERKRRGLSSKE